MQRSVKRWSVRAMYDGGRANCVHEARCNEGKSLPHISIDMVQLKLLYP